MAAARNTEWKRDQENLPNAVATVSECRMSLREAGSASGEVIPTMHIFAGQRFEYT